MGFFEILFVYKDVILLYLGFIYLIKVESLVSIDLFEYFKFCGLIVILGEIIVFFDLMLDSILYDINISKNIDLNFEKRLVYLFIYKL